MPSVDANRLKGNYAAAHVTARLSAECLVRPVAADTDVGIDLYCETVDEGRPFLHFWVQVKAGAQCRTDENDEFATCPFSRAHLDYWARQPVPVFAALVPVAWPVQDEPCVYLVDVTGYILEQEMRGPGRASLSLKSSYRWPAHDAASVGRFLREAVPEVTARLRCKLGTVAPIPTATPSYVNRVPPVPVRRFRRQILDQIRRTAAFGIFFARDNDAADPEIAHFRRKLAAVVSQFDDDPHWENFASLALSSHADKQFPRAVGFYDQAIASIRGDKKVSTLPSWQGTVRELESLRDLARCNKSLPPV